MKPISAYLKSIPREQISLLPTPFHRLNRISELLHRNIFIKRDDLTGFTFGGNKTRKFDFLVADALRKGCDTVIGIGANQSNFCRILAGVGARYGLEIHLVLNGQKPVKPTGNLLVDHFLGAQIHHVDTTDSQVRMAAAEALHRELEHQGKSVYFLPPGGSIPVGALGYFAGWDELLNDMAQSGLHFSKVLHASSSAGTQAGLVLGQAASDWAGEIIGISVDEPKERLIENVYQLAQTAGRDFGIAVDRHRVHVNTNYIGAGYGLRTPACEEAVELFARLEGIFLDYVYTGKAAAGLIDYCRAGRIGSEENVIFLHTGGNVEFFA